MKTIPFKAALKLLEQALDINVPGYSRTESFVLQTEEEAESFLELELEEDYHEFFFCFKEADNQTVKVNGDTMTLVYDDAVADGIAPTIEIRLMIPMQLEAPEEDVCRPTPEVIAALRHVRSFVPEVDRVVFWGDGKWTYLTDDHAVPSFEGLPIDVGILEDAVNSVDCGSPRVFYPPTATL